MSLTSLASSFANTYVNAPLVARDDANAGTPGSSIVAVPSTASTLGDNLKALTDYIPSEVLTLYIGAIAAIESWPFASAGGMLLAGAALDAARAAWLYWTFVGCLVAAPAWVATGVILSSKVRPTWQPFVWPMIAAAVAFWAYALAIPKSWLAETMANGGLSATLILLSATPVLHTITLLYTKLFPPPLAR